MQVWIAFGADVAALRFALERLAAELKLLEAGGAAAAGGGWRRRHFHSGNFAVCPVHSCYFARHSMGHVASAAPN